MNNFKVDPTDVMSVKEFNRKVEEGLIGVTNTGGMVDVKKAFEVIESQAGELEIWKKHYYEKADEVDFLNKKLSKLRFMMTTLNDIMKARVSNVDEIIELIDSKPEVEKDTSEKIKEFIAEMSKENEAYDPKPYENGRPIQISISLTSPMNWDSEETGRIWEMFAKNVKYRANLDWKTLEYTVYDNFGEPHQAGHWDDSKKVVRLRKGWKLEKQHKRPNFIKIQVLEDYESFGYTIAEGTELLASLGVNGIYHVNIGDKNVDSVAEYNEGQLIIYGAYGCSDVYMHNPEVKIGSDREAPKAIAVKAGMKFYIGEDITVFEKGDFILAERVEEEGKTLFYATNKDLNVSISVASWNKRTKQLTFVVENQFEVLKAFYKDEEPKLPPSRVKVKIKKDVYHDSIREVKSFEEGDTYIAFRVGNGDYEAVDETGKACAVARFNKASFKAVPTINALYEITKEME